MSKSISSALQVVGGILLYFLFLQNTVFAQAGDFTRYDTQTSFVAANSSPTIVNYDAIANGSLPTYEYTFATEGVKIKPNDPNYTNPLLIGNWSSLLSGKEIIITGKEGMEFNFTTPVNAFGYDFVEPTTCLPGFCPTTFIDSTFVISIYSGATKLTEYTFTPANNVATFFGVSSAQSFDKIVIQETDGGVDDEVYGKLYIKRNPPAPTCGNPRAQVNFVPYVGIPAADQNSSTNAWDSITLGNKAVVAGGTFFDVTDGTNAIDDGTIVSAGLQNFAVSRHNGYIEFLALGRRLSTYYGYYQGTIKLENVQVDRVEPGLTTATWADIGLEAVEGDTVTKVSDNEVSFKLAFANQGDGFRVYLKNPTPTECTCPTGQEKKPDPKSPVCIVRARVDGVQDTTVTLTGYGHLAGECTVAGIVPQAPQTPSPNLVVTAGQQRVGWAQSSPWTFQLDPLLTCPANTTKTACMFTYGVGPLGEITCGCYPNGYTTKTFIDPKIDTRPVYARSGSPERFCAEQGYVGPTTVKQVYNYTGTGAIWGEEWGSNNGLEAIKEVECSNKPNVSCQKFVNPTINHKPVYARPDSPKQFCKEQGYNESATVLTRYNYFGNGSLWNGTVWEINNGLEAITEVSCCKLEDKSSNICVNAGCAAGQYWCQAENMCKPAGQSCSAVTCNNNNTCEAGESCNCGDCTNGGADDADKCGLSNGAQMVCTKDKDNTTTAGAFSSVTAQENFNTVNNQLATVLSQPGNANIAVGEFGTAATELKMTQYDWKDAAGNFISFSSFTQGEAWTKVKELLSIPASAQVLWSTSSIKYENDSLGNNERYLYSYVIQQTSGVQKQIFFATEYLPVINGWRKIYFISKDYPLSTTTTGTEVCQNFTNPTLFGKPLALGSPSVGSSGIVPFCTEQGFRGTSTVVNTSFLTGWLTLWKSNGTGWEPNQNGDKINEIRCCGIPANATGTPVQVGACCPAGAQWDSSQGKCLTACEPIVTLKQGSDLTTIKNPQGEAFSTNTTCANKNISLSPCNTTMGVVADGTSTSGNKLYKWPKTASGLSKDYNLVEINGQCWFADNLQEIPSNVPTSGVNDNLSPHNFYGYYDYVGTGINRPEGFLYQFDAATNNPAPASAPAGSLQGVCPAGWHVATDCEYQYLEHTLGMTVTEQQAVGVRTSGAVGTAMKSGGNSGFDMPLSGARRYNTGFINGGSEGHLWSTDCDASAWPAGGCYKRILNVTDGNIARIKGDGGTYDSAHHAAGSVRCVKDGSTTPVNTCPVPGCAEGEYYCHAELKCKAAGEACGTVTCNNNNVCDTNESCNCADCNDKADHCAINGTGEQLICTKDTTPPCFTDKFPYCFPACLDGYTRNASGQCVINTTTSGGLSCTATPVTDACTDHYGDRTSFAKVVLSDGKVFISGGVGANACAGSVVGTSAEIYDPVTNTWEKLPAMPVGRANHAAVEIDNNRLMVSGGNGSCTSTSIYNRTTKTWSTGPTLLSGKALHIMKKLNNGNVLIIGGGSPWCGSALDAQTFNTATSTITNLVSYPAKNGSTTTVIPLDDGQERVLAMGGTTFNGTGIMNNLAALFTPSTNTWSATGNMQNFQVANRATLLSDGRVLVAGGYVMSGGPVSNCGGYGVGTDTNCVEIFNPVTQTWSQAARMNIVRESADIVRMSNNKVLVCGNWYLDRKTCEIYDPTTDTWTSSASMNIGHTTASTTSNDYFIGPFLVPLPTGKVIAFGQSASTGLKTQTSTEIYDVGANTWANNVSGYSTCVPNPTNTTITYTHRTATGGNTAIATCQIGEMLVGGGCTNAGTGGAYFQAGFPIAKNESWQTYTPTYDSAYWHSLEYPATAGGPIVASADGYACATGFSVTDVQATAICSSIPAGETTTIRKGSVAQKSLAQCSAGEVRIAGGCRYTQGGAYYQAGFPLNKGESYSGLNAIEDGFVCDTGRATTLVESRVVCRPARAGETITIRSSPSSGTTTYSTAQCSPGEKVLGGGCKNITGGLYYYAGYPVKSGSPDIANNIATNDAFSCGSGASGTYPQAYAICASNATVTVGNSCQNFTGNVESHGGYLHIGQASINQFCVEKGYSSATLVSQYTQSGSCRLWNGTSWYEDTACEAVSNVQCCNTPVVSSTVSSGPQVGACCPPGSAWNSVENRCVPSTCGVGQFYCAAQKKCLPGGTTCDTTVCNNNGLCEGEESCQCGDCVDGPTQTDPTKKADDKDKCSIIGGIQAMCSDDNLTDNKPGACCVAPKKWNTATNTCAECTTTQAPSELQVGVDKPYITCNANGDTLKTHFRYRLTPVANSTAVTPASTSTDANFKIQKLLAKAVSGVCPSNASAYVANLTGIVANDKICVRLVYDNATTGAVSNALITDSLPAGFTRVTNSTKNCLTPTGSPELCSDASGMGGAIGNNGWSGSNFSLTPHAGFYAVPTNKTTGDFMSMGKKRYIYSQQCTGSGGIGGESFVYGFGNEASRTFNGCSYSAVAASIPSDILGFKNYSWISCNPQSGQEGEVLIPGFTNDSSKNYPNSVCQYTSILQNFTYSMADRYAHWLKCTSVGGQEGEEFIHGFDNDTNDSIAVGSSYPNCGLSSVAKKGVYDTLDTTNGKGYIQYMVDVTSTPLNTLLPTTTITGTITGKTSADTGASTAVINPSVTGGVIDTTLIFISDISPVGNQILHTGTLPFGTYNVECFYGNSTTVDVSSTAIPSTCTKNIEVKNTAQGCSRVYAYRGNTLSDEMSSENPFNASFRCGSRLPGTGVANPFSLTFGTQNPAYLAYDPAYSLLLDYLGIGPLSSQTNNYTIPTGSTDISCAVKIGTGYSTNNACSLKSCVGGECARPQTFSVVHSANAICTTSPEDDYSIGCNPDAPDANRTACTNWFKTNFDINAGKTKFNIPFTMNGRVRDIECTIIPANSPLLGGLNMYENYACSTKLPNGETVQLFNGDVSLQTTAYTVKFDDIDPTASDIVYYTDTTLSTLATEINKWQKKPITAQVTCVDRPTEESTSCACAKVVDAGTTAATALWSQGVPDARLGADIMRYTRTFTTTTPAQKIKVRDTANNASPEKDIPAISIDTQPPVVAIAESGTGATKTLTFTISDSASKIWRATGTPSTTPASTNIQSLIYKKVPKADANIALYDENCGLPLASTNYASVTDTAALPAALPALPITGVNLNTEVLSYCIQDNAGNVTRGVYPSEITGCFSATNMSPVPTLSTYKTGLQANITANKFGYGLSEDPTNATCFRGILSSNITTLVTNQYNARTTNTLSWSQPATLKSNAALANTNGYYYHSFTANTTSSSPLNVSTNNTVTLGTPSAPSPTGTGQKIVVVDGGNIQINNNIDYSGSDKTLVLIARKINNSGGNIFIDPSVTRIDAILIADGALMNGITTNSGTTSSTTSLKNWIDHANELSNRLIINGRLYSFNTRGGSLDTTLKPLTTSIGKYFDQIQLKSDATPAKAASMDFEGFRIVNSVGSQTCSLSLNYRVFTSLSLPTILQRPVGYGGGMCSF